MNNAIFGNIKLITIKKRMNYLVLELNYYTTMFFFLGGRNLLAMKMMKTQILINKRV